MTQRSRLLAVSGASPQVVTETLYALAREDGPEAVPAEVVLVTTSMGRDTAVRTLLGCGDAPGQLAALRRDYDLPEVAFDESRIHVITDAQGQPLDDIRTADDNKAVGNFLLKRIRTLTGEDDPPLHVSIAGGRKTMGQYAAAMMWLFARESDELSHVLVSAEFEGLPDFFYPTPRSVLLASPQHPDGLDAARAEVTLARLPFLRLRTWLSTKKLFAEHDFSTLIEESQFDANQTRMYIDPEKKQVRISNREVQLTRENCAYLAFLAYHWHEHKEWPLRAHDDINDEPLAEEFRQVLIRCTGEERPVELTGSVMNQRKSKINGAIKQALGTMIADPFLITSMGGYGKTRHGLSCPNLEVTIVDAERKTETFVVNTDPPETA